MPRWSPRIGGVAVLAVFLLAPHSLWLIALGAFLVRVDPPEKADTVAALAGDSDGLRILEAGALVRSGYAPKALVSSGSPFYGVVEDGFHRAGALS